MVEQGLPVLLTPVSRDAVVYRRVCLRLHSAPCGRVEDSKYKCFMRLPEKENTLPQSEHSQAAELHNHAAHAHAVAACGHSTGDHASDHELTQQAYDRSQEAAQLSKKIAKQEPDSMAT